MSSTGAATEGGSVGEVGTARVKGSGKRDEFSQRQHETHLKVREEMEKVKDTDDVKQQQAASKGVMKREKQEGASDADEADVKQSVDEEGNNNRAVGSTDEAKEAALDEQADSPILAERQRELALRKAAAVFDDVKAKSRSQHHAHLQHAHDDGKQHKDEEEQDEAGSSAGEGLKDKAAGQLHAAKESVQHATSDAKVAVTAKVEDAGAKLGQLKEQATAKMDELQQRAKDWKNGAVHSTEEAAASLSSHAQAAKERLVNTPAEVREKGEQLQAKVKEGADKAQNTASTAAVKAKETALEVEDEARGLYHDVSSRLSEQAAHIRDTSASTLQSVQRSLEQDAALIAERAGQAKDGLVRVVTAEGEALKHTVSSWTAQLAHADTEQHDATGSQQTRDAAGSTEDVSTLQSMREQLAQLLPRDSSANSERGAMDTPTDSLPSPTSASSPSSASTSSSSVPDLSSSAAADHIERVPSLGGFDGLRGEDAGMGDGARLAAMVQDMSEL